MRLSRFGKILVIAFGRLLSTLLVLGVAAVLSRYLSRQDYGVFHQAMLVYTPLMGIILPSLPDSLYFFLPKVKTKSGARFARRTMADCFLIGLAIGACVIASGPLLAAFFGDSRWPALAVPLGLVFPFAFARLTVDPVLIVDERPGTVLAVTVAGKTVAFLAMVGAVAAGAGLIEVLWAWLGASIFEALLAALLSWRTWRKWGWDTAPGRREQWAYAAPLLFGAVVATAAIYADRYVVSAMFAPATYALYANGGVAITFLSMLLSATQAVVIPELVPLYEEGRLERILAVCRGATASIMSIVLPAAIFFWVFARDLMVAVFSEAYADADVFLRWYCVIIVVRAASVTWAGMLRAAGRTWAYLFVQLTAAVVAPLAAALLASWLGPTGATIGNLFGRSTAFIVVIGAVMHWRELRTARIFPWGRFIAIFVTSVLVSLGCSTFRFLPLGSMALVVLTGSVFAALYLPFAWRQGWFGDAITSRLRGVGGGRPSADDDSSVVGDEESGAHDD